MRIIAGHCKGRSLASPTWPGLRPTSDKLRETLFNLLAPRIEGARFADLFAGTGAVGIEALSRGAAHAAFVERDRRAVALIRENLRRCAIAEGYTIEQLDARQAVARLRQNSAFDIVHLDPPYDLPDIDGVVADMSTIVAPDGIIVVEHATRLPLTDDIGELVRERSRRSGDSTLSFYVRRT
jgi:16S rRNA (guanine966-N2)-methyltransferase